VSRKLQDKQDRRLAEKRRREAQRRAARRGNLITVGVAVLVVAAVAALVIADRFDPVGTDLAAANCTAIETHPDEGNQHVEPGTDVVYETVPPTSGSHYPEAADSGFYTGSVSKGALVHSLEHGIVVVWYDPDVPEEVADDLEQIQRQEPAATIVAPYEDLPEPHNFALTGWRTSMLCEQVAQEAVDRFRARFQGRGPENAGVPTFEPEGS
jgi:hypothetical protein